MIISGRSSRDIFETPQAHKVSSGVKQMMASLELKINELWSKSAKTIHDRFGLQPPLNPKSIVIVNENDCLRWGGYYDNRAHKLILSNEVTGGKASLSGIIYRESLIAALPDTLCEELRRDLGAEFARQFLSKQEQKSWIESWKAISSIRIRANMEYRSYELMNWIYSLGGKQQIDLLVHEFVSMARYGKILNFEEYAEYMTKRGQDILVSLGHTEVKILDTLLKNQDVSVAQLATLAGFSNSWFSTQINRLKRKYVLVGLTTTPFSKIGIRSFHVLLSGSPSHNPTRFISGCPFLYNVSHILNGPWEVMARLALPDNSESIQALEIMASRLNDIGMAIDISETYSAGLSNSFYHYNVGTHRWAIPWVAMCGWGERIEEEALDQIVERIDVPASTTDEYIDGTDMQILGNIHSGISSSRALRQHLAIGQNNLLRRLKRLRSAELIRRVWDVHNLGLVERVALRTTDRRTGSILDAWARELPRIILHYGERRDLLMLADLPLGGSIKMMDTIRSLRWNIIASPLGSRIWGQWRFPEHLWDVERQRWQAPKEEIAHWISSIEQECEVAMRETAQSEIGKMSALRRQE
jgi:hypothetical protein